MSAVWTIGHSTRSVEELVSILKSHNIEEVVDVRSVPRSRWNPQFNKPELEHALRNAGIAYRHTKELGGLRNARKVSPNMGWRNKSFRGFADYMQTHDFEAALTRLIDLARRKRVAIMCAEVVPWKCHRSLIADALTVRGFEVVEIFDEHKSQAHELTKFAVVTSGKITYPPQEVADAGAAAGDNGEDNALDEGSERE
jgi:uncharacterized protein (DUF488 family)